jgi:RNA 2',3'-cyclic 3'-phosphodiesterase
MGDVGKTRLRIFCAVEIPQGIREFVSQYIGSLRELYPNVRASWERQEKLHLTLKFLGDIAPERVEDLKRAATRAVEGVEAFDISIEGTGAFPTRGVARVLWLGVVDKTGSLATLQRRLEDECAAERFAREERAFNPHLTLARIRTPAGVRPLAASHTTAHLDSGPFRVTEIVVMKSELGAGGSRYTPLSRHGLKAHSES